MKWLYIIEAVVVILFLSSNSFEVPLSTLMAMIGIFVLLNSIIRNRSVGPFLQKLLGGVVVLIVVIIGLFAIMAIFSK